MFLASLLRHTVVGVRAWCGKSQQVATEAATAVAVVQNPATPKHGRPSEHHPTLWEVKCEYRKTNCGPTAVSAIIGVPVDQVNRAIQQYRRNRRQVRGTQPHELQWALRSFGHDMRLVADFATNPPTLASWVRERSDQGAAYIVIVTEHAIAVRGEWVVDTWTRGVPVKLKDAPHRRKRVRLVYRVMVGQDPHPHTTRETLILLGYRITPWRPLQWVSQALAIVCVVLYFPVRIWAIFVNEQLEKKVLVAAAVLFAVMLAVIGMDHLRLWVKRNSLFGRSPVRVLLARLFRRKRSGKFARA